MPKNQYGQHEKQRILLQGESGKISIRQLCLKQGIPEQTYYRWRREALAGRSVFALRLRSAKTRTSPNANEAADIFTGAHMAQLPDQEPFQSAIGIDDPCPDDILEHDLRSPQPPISHCIQRRLAPRNTFAVLAHGKLLRGDFKFLQVALPDELRERLERTTQGSLNQTILGLVEHALDALDRENQTLHLYNAADGLPAVLNTQLEQSNGVTTVEFARSGGTSRT